MGPAAALRLRARLGCDVDDTEVIDAFLEGATAVFGPSLHVEGGTLKVDGWWALAYRVTGRTFIVRDEEAPTDTTAAADVTTALAARGLAAVGADLPAIALLTYTILDLGYAPWVLWSTDAVVGEADLNAKATEESFLEGGSTTVPASEPATDEYLRGARRVAGAPSRVVLTVGVGDDRATPLRTGLADCRFERRAFGEIEPSDCGSLLPTLVLVDATGPAGAAFIDGLHASGGVTAPVVAITSGGGMRAGVDATVDPADPPDVWVHLIRGMLG